MCTSREQGFQIVQQADPQQLATADREVQDFTVAVVGANELDALQRSLRAGAVPGLGRRRGHVYGEPAHACTAVCTAAFGRFASQCSMSDRRQATAR